MLPIALAVALNQQQAPTALLLGITVKDQTPVQDVRFIREGLLRRGWTDAQIHVRTGAMTLGQLQEHIQQFSRTASKAYTLVFISGDGLQVNGVPAVRLSDTNVQTSAILGAIGSQSQNLHVLLDTGYSNLLYSVFPAITSAIVMDGNWQSRNTPRAVGTVVHNGETVQVGVLSYILGREIPFARNFSDLSYRVGKYKDSGSMAAIWADLPRTQVFGRGLDPFPGVIRDR